MEISGNATQKQGKKKFPKLDFFKDIHTATKIGCKGRRVE
jgi:hypothetical protein